MKPKIAGSWTLANGTAIAKTRADAATTASASRRSIGLAGNRDRKLAGWSSVRCGIDLVHQNDTSAACTADARSGTLNSGASSTRRQDHDHLAALEARLHLDLGDLGHVFLDAIEQPRAELLMRHF